MRSLGLTIWSAMDGEVGPGNMGERLFWSGGYSGTGIAKSSLPLTCLGLGRATPTDGQQRFGRSQEE